MAGVVFNIEVWQAILLCFLFAILYVGSLYIWVERKYINRDHPDTVRKRFISVSFVCVVVIPLVRFFGSESSSDQAHTVWEWLGIRFSGLMTALVIPLFLTMILFLGPLSLHYMDGVFSLYLEPRYWINSFANAMWTRNHVVAVQLPWKYRPQISQPNIKIPGTDKTIRFLAEEVANYAKDKQLWNPSIVMHKLPV